jgi:hypothetical protein
VVAVREAAGPGVIRLAPGAIDRSQRELIDRLSSEATAKGVYLVFDEADLLATRDERRRGAEALLKSTMRKGVR